MKTGSEKTSTRPADLIGSVDDPRRLRPLFGSSVGDAANFSGGCPLTRRNLRIRRPHRRHSNGNLIPFVPPYPEHKPPSQRSNASNVLAMLYSSSVAQADFCALSSAHLPLPRHNRIDCRLIRLQIMKYRQIATATRPLKGRSSVEWSQNGWGGVPEKFARPPGEKREKSLA